MNRRMARPHAMGVQRADRSDRMGRACADGAGDPHAPGLDADWPAIVRGWRHPLRRTAVATRRQSTGTRRVSSSVQFWTRIARLRWPFG